MSNQHVMLIVAVFGFLLAFIQLFKGVRDLSTPSSSETLGAASRPPDVKRTGINVRHRTEA
jgi:hypothetical protein